MKNDCPLVGNFNSKQQRKTSTGHESDIEMKITIIDTFYVGFAMSACLSDVGIEVTCVDIDQKKIDGLKNDILQIYEPG